MVTYKDSQQQKNPIRRTSKFLKHLSKPFVFDLKKSWLQIKQINNAQN